jgi:predicted nucleic acid-binding protein
MEPRQRLVSGLSETDIGLVIEALCKVGRPVEIHFLWRPQLRDAADEMVLETAIAGGAEAIVTFNRRDFGDAPARFGVALISPPEALERMKR